MTEQASLSLRGEIDLANASQLAAALRERERLRPSTLRVDLRELLFMDAAALRVLVEAARRAHRDGRRLLLVNPRPTIQRLFALTGADGTLNVVFD